MTKPKIHKEKIGNIESDFITLTSHQLRTPLSGTKWLLELLQKKNTGRLNKKQQDLVDKLHQANEQMIVLVNDLLEVSRLESGQTKLYMQPTDLVPIINSVVREKAVEIQRKKTKITLTIEPEPFPLVMTEPAKINQVLVNILQNAITYAYPKAEIHIILKLDRSNALVQIVDTGVGIPADQQKNMFKKFFRGSNILQFESTGTGLGMFISKSFVEASGGKIWFESKLGKGTTFSFTLPLHNQ